MANIQEIKSFISELHPSQMRFLMDMTTEELEYLKTQSFNQYESLFEESGTNKVRAINQMPELPQNFIREDRVKNGLKKFFERCNKLSILTDKEFANVLSMELWATQSIYSVESAILENAVARLDRSEQLKLPSFDDDIMD